VGFDIKEKKESLKEKFDFDYHKYSLLELNRGYMKWQKK